MVGIVKVLLIVGYLLGFMSSAAVAEVYAPLLDTSKVKNPYFRSLPHLDLPDKSEVPVEAYVPASLLYISNITSTGNSEFQENRIVYLTTNDSSSKVVDFYGNKLSGWNRRSVKHKEVFLKTGEQFFWGGSERLNGPRVEVIDLTSGEQTLDIPLSMLKKSFPEMKTAVKVYYEKSSSPLLDVDIPKLVDSCVNKEIESTSKIYGGDPTTAEAQKFLRRTAEGTCAKVKKACQKSKEERECQRFARRYLVPAR